MACLSFVCLIFLCASSVILAETGASKSERSKVRTKVKTKEAYSFELLADRITALETENAKLKARLDDITINRYRRQTTIPGEVGFTAIISQHLKSLGVNQAIVFDRTISNLGSGYDAQTGYFIAPVPGTYQFFTTIMSENHNDYIETELVKNGTQLVELYSGGSSGHDSSSNMAVVYLKQGDHVWVKVHQANSNTFSIHCCFSTFSGVLLHLDEEALPIVG